MEARRTLTRLAAPLAVLATALIGAPAQAATSDYDTAIIPTGTLVAGIDVGGMSITQAATTLKEQLAPTLDAPVTMHVGNKQFQLSGSDAGVKLDALLTARRAFHEGRDAIPDPGSATQASSTTATRQAGGAASGVTVAPAVTVSDAKVGAWAAQVTKKVTRQPVSATLKLGLTSMKTTKASRGFTVDTTAMSRQVRDAFADPTVDRTDLREAVVPLEPKTSLADLRKQNGTIITVDRSGFKLRLFKNLRLEKTYGIAVGMAGLETPAGTYSIQNKQVDPAWHVPNSDWAGSLAGQVIPGGAADNPLKARWMGIYDGVGIHGTAEDWSIGSQASHGCIRMHVSDVIDLYSRVPVGAKVLID